MGAMDMVDVIETCAGDVLEGVLELLAHDDDAVMDVDVCWIPANLPTDDEVDA